MMYIIFISRKLTFPSLTYQLILLNLKKLKLLIHFLFSIKEIKNNSILLKTEEYILR